MNKTDNSNARMPRHWPHEGCNKKFFYESIKTGRNQSVVIFSLMIAKPKQRSASRFHFPCAPLPPPCAIVWTRPCGLAPKGPKRAQRPMRLFACSPRIHRIAGQNASDCTVSLMQHLKAKGRPQTSYASDATHLILPCTCLVAIRNHMPYVECS